MTPLTLITEQRDDAIGRWEIELTNNLKKIDPKLKHINVNNQSKIKFFSYILQVINFIKIYLLINKQEILLFTDPKSIKANIAFLIKNKKYIMVHHLDTEPSYYRFFTGITLVSLLKKFDGLIATSKRTINDLEAEKIDPSKISLVYSGVNHKVFNQIELERRPRIKYILFVGTEIPRKNFSNALKAFKLLKKDFPDLFLVKTGNSGGKDYRIISNGLINKLGLKKDIIFTGFIDDKQLRQYYLEAEMLLFPSLLEGFGLPIIEAMACGCPVVTSNIDPMREITKDCALHVNPHSHEDIAIKCKELMQNSELKKKLTKSGLSNSKKYSWDKTAQLIYKIIK
tara:strand:- start:2412 stop:3434 length:1023 start_codon:yes stop_codon:yes gene_type:complete